MRAFPSRLWLRKKNPFPNMRVKARTNARARAVARTGAKTSAKAREVAGPTVALLQRASKPFADVPGGGILPFWVRGGVFMLRPHPKTFS
jgi:hypothetical protein